MALLRLLNWLFHRPPWLAFLLMGIAAGGFALCSFNLLYLFQANFNLIATYGAMAAFDGGILQLIELTAWGYLALACYVVFKVCADGVLRRIHSERQQTREARSAFIVSPPPRRPTLPSSPDWSPGRNAARNRLRRACP